MEIELLAKCRSGNSERWQIKQAQCNEDRTEFHCGNEFISLSILVLYEVFCKLNMIPRIVKLNKYKNMATI